MVRPAKPCNTTGCPNLQPCPDHPRQPWPAHRRSARNHTRPRDHNTRVTNVMRRHQGVCYWCGLPGANQVDHVLEVADGGSHDEHNMRPIHSKPCHANKTLAARRARAAGQPLVITLGD